MKIKLNEIKSKLIKKLTKLNKKQKILSIVAASLVLAGILLIIFLPSLTQAVYYGKVSAIESNAINESEIIKTNGSIEENETLSEFMSRIKTSVDKIDVEKRFTELNEEYENVSKLTFEETDLSQYVNKATQVLTSYDIISKAADNVKTLNDEFTSIIGSSDSENVKDQLNELLSSISENKDTLNSIDIEELMPAADSVIKVFNELEGSIDKYKELSDELNKFNSKYDTQVANMQSINSWKILRDNATLDEYKEMCQQKIDEFTEQAESGIDNINKIGENMQNFKEQFETSYKIFLKRLGINKVDYPTKEQIENSIDSAKNLVFSE
ncbi:MAG: hypothetical protein R2876_05615 [Eubacteriales bacterium]